MNIPTKLTIARIVCIPVFVIAWYLPMSGSVLGIATKNIVLTGIFIALCLTDWLDGYLARKWQQITDLGKFLDPIADKILVFTIYLLLLKSGTIDPISVSLMLTREFIVASIRMLEAQQGVVVAASGMGKMKTVLQMCSLILFLLFGQVAYTPLVFLMFSVYYVSVLATIISGWQYVTHYLRITKKE